MPKSLSALIIEDSENDAILLARELQRGGFDLAYERIASAAALRTALAGKPWDVVFSDHAMPHFSGIEVHKLLGESGLDLPFILISGVAEEDLGVEALRCGAHDYLTKGNLARLVPVVERELREAETRRERKQAEMVLRLHAEASSAAANGILITDLEGTIIWVNAAVTALTGYTEADLLGQNHRILKSGRQDKAFYGNLWTTILNGQVWHGEIINQRKDGSCYDEEMTITPVRGRDGNVTNFIVIKQDVTKRKKEQELVRASETRYRRLFETAQDGILLLDSKTAAITDVNPFLIDLLGYTREEMLGKKLWEIGLFRDIDASKSAFESLQVGGYIRYEDLPLESKSGEPMDVEFVSNAYLVDGQTVIQCNIRDVTERMRAADASRLLSSIVECSDDAIIGKSLDGIVLSWNQGAERIYGYSFEEMVGQPISRLVPPGHDDELPGIMEDVKQGQKIEHLETERMKKDGQRIFVALTISPIRDHAGAIVGASAIARDITERKRGEQALHQSEERYRSLAYAASQLVWSSNPLGEVVDDVPTWREFTGQSIDEIKGKGWLQALHPDDSARTAEVWSRALKNPSFYMTEFRLRRRDGEYRWMAIHGVPVMDEHGKVREWVGTCGDITDRMLAEEEVHQLNLTLEKRVLQRTAELQAANKELEAFAYSVSHDLRAPLRAMAGFSRILLEEYAPQLPEEAQRYLRIAVENSVQMGDLIDALLAFSRLGRQPLSKHTVAPGELVRQALQDLRAEQEGRQVEISLGELPPCQGDPLLLKQVFFNLLSNAFKYTRKCASARIEVGSVRFGDLDRQTQGYKSGAPLEVSEDSPVYYVRDNGAGFDMLYVDKLFGVFQRLHRTEEYEGTGVGLATVRRIITRHGGSVWAEAALNQGATFYFTLAEGSLADTPTPGEPDTSPASETHLARPAEV
jgi:PAS domain S-box-containing protein